MLVQLALILVIYTAFFFALVFAEYFAFRAAEGLAEWLNPRRIALAAAIAAVLVGSGVAIAVSQGWMRLAPPNESPGFEEGRPEVSRPARPVGPAPTIKNKVKKSSQDAEDKKHQDNLKEFEGK